MYRIFCRYEPGYRHLAGADKASWHWTRGAWTVLASHGADQGDKVVRAVRDRHKQAAVLCVLCPTPRKRGTRCNPRALLQEYFDYRTEQRQRKWFSHA